MRRVLALAGALLALTALAHGTPATAAAQTPAGTRASGLSVTALTGVLRDGEVLQIDVAVAGGEALPDPALTVALERRTVSRFDYQQALEAGGDARSTVGAARVPLDPAALGAGPVPVTVPLTELGIVRVADATQGVYPLRLALESGGEVVDEVVTSVVLLADPLGPPVRAALLVPVAGELGLVGDGARVAFDPLAGDLGPEGRLPGLAAALAAAPPVPLTVATDGAVLEEAQHAAAGYTAVDDAGTVRVPAAVPLEALGDAEPGPAERAAALLRDVRAVTARPEVDQIALPYASADLRALAVAGLDGEVRRAVAQGVRSVEQVTGRRPAPEVLWPPDGVDARTIDVLDAAVGSFVLDATALSGDVEPAAVTPPPVRRVRTALGDAVRGAVADPWLAAALADLEGPAADGAVVAAQRVLGETAAVYFERPYLPEPRGLLLAPPQRWEVTGPVLEALLQGLAGAPWLQPVTLPDLLATVSAPPEPQRLDPSPAPQGLDEDYLADVQAAREAVAALRNVLPGDDATAARASRLLDLAVSTDYRGAGEERGRTLVASVQAAADAVAEQVSVLQAPLITLTSRDGQVPVTLRSDAPVPIDVTVELSSPRFAFPEGARRTDVTLQPGEPRTLFFEAQARTPGATHPIAIRVTDSSGPQAQELATGSVVVRSTDFSLTAVLLTAGGALFLTAWWVRDVRRRRAAATAAASADGRQLEPAASDRP